MLGFRGLADDVLSCVVDWCFVWIWYCVGWVLTGWMLYFSGFGLIVVAFCCFGFGCVWFGLVFLRRRVCVGFAVCGFGWVLASASGFAQGCWLGGCGVLVGWCCVFRWFLSFRALGHVFVLCWFGLALGAIWCGFLDFVLSCGLV